MTATVRDAYIRMRDRGEPKARRDGSRRHCATHASTSMTFTFYPRRTSQSGEAMTVEDADVLIAPVSGACGNVGQLACDALALNWNLTRVGTCDFEHLSPVVGRDALFDDTTTSAGSHARAPSGSLACAFEVYSGVTRASDGAEKRVVVVQIRSDACVGARRAFVDEYSDFLLTFANAKRVVLVSALPASVGEAEAQIGGTKWRAARGDDEFLRACAAVDLTALESNVCLPDDVMHASVDPHWALMDVLDAKDVARKVGCLVAVCSEGDNSADGAGMALAVARACDIVVDDASVDASAIGGDEPVTYIGPWRVPRSWSVAFGTRAMRREMFA